MVRVAGAFYSFRLSVNFTATAECNFYGYGKHLDISLDCRYVFYVDIRCMVVETAHISFISIYSVKICIKPSRGARLFVFWVLIRKSFII